MTNKIEFKLEGAEYKLYQEWRKSHSCKEAVKHGPVQVGFEFIFSTTSVLDCVAVRCPFCEETKDLTDWDNL